MGLRDSSKVPGPEAGLGAALHPGVQGDPCPHPRSQNNGEAPTSGVLREAASARLASGSGAQGGVLPPAVGV